MEYTPSYRDDLYNGLYLEHHGILGQKWGVRRYQNEDGSRTSAGKTHERALAKKSFSSATNTSNLARLRKGRAVGSSYRVRQKQQMFENKIKKTGDKSTILRNTINDYRRGRIAQLKTKAEHREAKRAYKENKTSENYKNLWKARGSRLVKNGLLSVGTMTRGKYNRYRDSGNSIVSSALKATGNMMVTNMLSPIKLS